MADTRPKKQIPLRLSAKLYDQIAAWAEDDFRSVNGQIEYLLTECVRQRKKNGILNEFHIFQNRECRNLHSPFFLSLLILKHMLHPVPCQLDPAFAFCLDAVAVGAGGFGGSKTEAVTAYGVDV